MENLYAEAKKVAFLGSDKCIQELFEAQVERTPSSIALIVDDQEVTYQSLNDQANELAHYLIIKGVKPNALVGICCEPSVHMVIGLLGILKAGGAYVPLDPSYPLMRLNQMREDSNFVTIITQEKFIGDLIEEGEAICIDNKAFKDHINALPRENIKTSSIRLKSKDLAYVIFTSGSTGKPKGVMVEHQSLVNLYEWFAEEFLTEDVERNLLMSSLSFDLTQKNIFATLIRGKVLVIVGAHRIDRESYRDAISKHQITILNCAPSAWWMLHESAVEKQFPSLKKLVLGGESLDSFDVVQFAKDQPETRLYNSYGPTECSDVTCFFEVDSKNYNSGIIPIGFGIPNTRHYILDANHDVVPVGAEGELYIGGACLARGYLNRPDLTSERFIADPFSDDSFDRLYKTGDLCRFRLDGNIEFLGRIDHQVKIRGFRVEVGEIENVLAAHEFVSNSVVLSKILPSGNEGLVAFVVCTAGSSVEGLREFLAARLPHYMIPWLFVELSTLPISPNGKIDRMALLGMELSKKNSSLSEMSFLQSEVWKIWSEILGFNEIDLDDDLFRIGGDSIMAVQIFSAINKEFFVNLQIEKMFSSSCISIRWYSNLIEEYQIAQLGEEEYSNLIDQINMMSDQDINSILGVD